MAYRGDREKYNEYMRDYLLRRYHKRRKDALKQLGGKCKKCGSKKRLELDHINPKKKSFNISKLWSVSKEKYAAELMKCQILCCECHEKKSIKERGFKVAKGRHGTISSYRYCRCARCRKAKSKANREYRLRKQTGA